MQKQWIGVCVAAGLLAACNTPNPVKQAQVPPQPAVCNGPAVEITGAEPRYEPLNASVNQDYQRNGATWRIVQNPATFSEVGLAAQYSEAFDSHATSSGEAYESTQLTAAHPTLPIPSYARVTNLANGRMLVVRINDRGPYESGRIITLSQASADRLNTSNNTRVRIDPIIVAPDGALSGPGTACTTIAKQTYALPARPDLNAGLGSASSAPQAPRPQGETHAIDNASLTPIISNETQTPVVQASSTAPVQANADQHAPMSATQSAPQAQSGAPATAAPDARESAASDGSYHVQVGAVSDASRAEKWQQELSQRFSIPGSVTPNGNVYRVRLGPFASKAQAAALQQRLMHEAQLPSFITGNTAQ